MVIIEFHRKRKVERQVKKAKAGRERKMQVEKGRCRYRQAEADRGRQR